MSRELSRHSSTRVVLERRQQLRCRSLLACPAKNLLRSPLNLVVFSVAVVVGLAIQLDCCVYPFGAGTSDLATRLKNQQLYPNPTRQFVFVLQTSCRFLPPPASNGRCLAAAKASSCNNNKSSSASVSAGHLSAQQLLHLNNKHHNKLALSQPRKRLIKHVDILRV